MNRPMETYRGEHFFHDGKLVYINRNMENFEGLYHNHDFLEIAYIAEGEGFHHIEDTVQKVRKGHIFFIPLGVSHVFRPTSAQAQPLIVNNCIFSSLLLPKLIAFVTDPDTTAFLKRMEEGSLGFESAVDRNDRFEFIFRALYEQNALSLEGSEDYLHALLLQLIIEFSRATLQLPESKRTETQNYTFQDVLEYVEKHYMHELTLSHLAQISRFSERHIQRLFRRFTGQSWHHYLQSVRIRRSRQLLRNSSDKISVVAERVGYKDIHSFNTVFKRNTGLTPGQYRREGRDSTTLNE
ncbi:AraC family transcriptional regulator [Paenibacillus sp. JCM 10914]|nr:ada regulatory protein, putative [Paenibacillus sp. JCM 10914]